MREIMKSEAMLETHEKVKILEIINDITGYFNAPRYHVWEATVELENKDDSIRGTNNR